MTEQKKAEYESANESAEREHQRRVKAGKKCPNYRLMWGDEVKKRSLLANQCRRLEADLDEYKKALNDKHEKLIKINDRLIKQEKQFSNSLNAILRALWVLMGLIAGSCILTIFR